MKVGDTVRIVDLFPYGESVPQGIVKGNTGTVARVYPHGVDVFTHNAANCSDSTGLGWFFTREQLEVVDGE